MSIFCKNLIKQLVLFIQNGVLLLSWEVEEMNLRYSETVFCWMDMGIKGKEAYLKQAITFPSVHVLCKAKVPGPVVVDTLICVNGDSIFFHMTPPRSLF